MMSFPTCRCVFVSAGLLAGCATAPEQGADWNAITKHGFRQIMPLQMPGMDLGSVPVVTIPKFTFEGYGVMIAAAATPEAGDPRVWGTAFYISEVVPELGAVLVPVRYADGHSDDFVGVRWHRQAVGIFRGSFENFADNVPLLVIANRPDDDNGHNPETFTIEVFLLQPAQNRVSHFTEVRSWTTADRYCWPGVALDHVMAITPPVPVNPPDGCDPEVTPP